MKSVFLQRFRLVMSHLVGWVRKAPRNGHVRTISGVAIAVTFRRRTLGSGASSPHVAPVQFYLITTFVRGTLKPH